LQVFSAMILFNYHLHFHWFHFPQAQPLWWVGLFMLPKQQHPSPPGTLPWGKFAPLLS